VWGISFEHDPDNEFDDFKWVSYWYPMFKIIFFKKDVYRKVLGDMRYAYFDKGLL
jgi:putative (di)nucleoside polyphosphate hydrolase